VSESRLERYFRAEGDHYRVVSRIRDRVVFAIHNLLRDPPFSRLHLISCRNLLIYLDRELQEQTMEVFRYACCDQAYLFLGVAETADEALFRALDKKHRIFATRARQTGRQPLPQVLATPHVRAVRQQREARPPSRSSAVEIHLAMLEEVAPPSVVVDERGYVLHISPSASHFLLQGGGPPANRIMDLVRPELRDELHVLLPRFRTTDAATVTVRFSGVQRHTASRRGPRPTAFT
jgi:two-component system, chemotaxis family, CheB/CheR fusion protein